MAVSDITGTTGTTGGTLGQRPLTRRVFLSSTSLDLPHHRERVRDVLLRLGLFPVAMEYFGAQEAAPRRPSPSAG